MAPGDPVKSRLMAVPPIRQRCRSWRAACIAYTSWLQLTSLRQTICLACLRSTPEACLFSGAKAGDYTAIRRQRAEYGRTIRHDRTCVARGPDARLRFWQTERLCPVQRLLALP